MSSTAEQITATPPIANLITSSQSKAVNHVGIDWKQSIPLISTLVCSILSVIPPTRLVGALALRSVNLLATADKTRTDALEKNTFQCIIDGAYLVNIILGIGAMAAGLPALVLASLSIDMAIQLTECIAEFQKGHITNALVKICVIGIDALMIAALVTGNFYIIMGALGLGIAIFAALAIANGRKGLGNSQGILNTVCYSLMGALSAITMCLGSMQYHYKMFNSQRNQNDIYQNIRKINTKDGYVYVLDKKVATINPYYGYRDGYTEFTTNAPQLYQKSYNGDINVVLPSDSGWNPLVATLGQATPVASGTNMREQDLT